MRRPFLVLAVAVLAAGPALGHPLDPAACDAAKQEQATMTDVPPLLEHGPEWTRANAPPQALQRVARWIELTEILSFRCGRAIVSAEARRAAAAADLIENPPEPAVPEASTLNSLPAPTGADTPAEKKVKRKARPLPKPPADTAASASSAPEQASPDQPPARKHKPKPTAASAAPPAGATEKPAPPEPAARND